MNYLLRILLVCLLMFPVGEVGAQNKPKKSEERLAKDTSGVDWDGPYVFYVKNKVVSKQIVKGKGGFELVLKEKSPKSCSRKLKCYVDDKDFFTFKLKKELTNEESVYEMPEKLTAISDIEGQYGAFKQFLIGNGVMNAKYEWTYGKGHLVTVGDFFDRGLLVTQTLWLIYHLEQQAERVGGKVHFILGNHDLMNMNDDFRYVRKKYFENEKLLQEDYYNLYKPHTELGRWLGTKNLVERIGDYVFVHAGISVEVANLGLSVEELNSKARDYYFDNRKAQQMKDNLYSTMYQFGISPMWYRGWGKQTIDPTEAETIMEKWKVGKFVIGHTLYPEVTYLMNRRVIDLDVEHAQGVIQGVLIEKGKEYKVNEKGERTEIRETNN